MCRLGLSYGRVSNLSAVSIILVSCAHTWFFLHQLYILQQLVQVSPVKRLLASVYIRLVAEDVVAAGLRLQTAGVFDFRLSVLNVLNQVIGHEDHLLLVRIVPKVGSACRRIHEAHVTCSLPDFLQEKSANLCTYLKGNFGRLE